MNLPDPDTQFNALELSDFLNRIKDELQLQERGLKSAQLNQDELEDYILDLNSYYYQSFNERFFPLYRAQLETDIKRLYKIAREESALKEDIIRNLKRAAQMYNHVKNGLNLLKQNHALTERLRLSINHSQEQGLLELIYALKDMQINLLTSLDLLKNCQILTNNQELMRSIQVYPFQSSLKELWIIWDPESNSFGRDFKRLMINLELYLKLLLKLSNSDDKFWDDRDNILDELIKVENNLTNKKCSSALTKWYKQYIYPQFLIYQELLILNIKQRDRKRIQNTASNFESWLQALLCLLGEVNRRSGNPESLLLELHQLSSADSTQINELIGICIRLEQSIKDLIKQHADAVNSSFPIFSDATDKILRESLPQFKGLLKEVKLTDYSLVNNTITQLNNQLSFLEMQLDHLNFREEHATKLQQQYELMLETIDAYQNLLNNTKNQLSRSLAPRNLNRQFKDLDLRVEHIPVNQGEAFPSAYLYLLDADSAQGQSEQDYIIQEEAGDIFLFRLDDLKDELIPNIVLSGKG